MKKLLLLSTLLLASHSYGLVLGIDNETNGDVTVGFASDSYNQWPLVPNVVYYLACGGQFTLHTMHFKKLTCKLSEQGVGSQHSTQISVNGHAIGILSYTYSDIPGTMRYGFRQTCKGKVNCVPWDLKTDTWSNNGSAYITLY